MNRILAEYCASQQGATDDTEEVVVAVSELIKEYDDLMLSLNAAEIGSYEYAMALQDLEKFHNSLTDAAKYLADGDMEVSAELQALIGLTSQYAREQEEATKAAEKGARTMQDLKDAYEEMKAAMSAAEVGSLEWADALKDVQGQADELLNIVDFLQEKEIAVSQSIWDQITALEAQGATIRDTAIETEDAADAAEKLADETERLKEEQEDAKGASDELKSSIKAQAKELLNLAKDAIQSVVDGYKKMREEAEDYAQTMRDIEEEFAQNRIETAEDKADALEEAALRNARNLQDIETDYQRARADIRAEDYEDAQDYLDKLAKIEQDYLEDKADEKLRHDRVLQDADKEYTDTMTEHAEERITKLKEEGEEYKNNRTTIMSMVKDLRDTVYEYAQEKVVEKWLDSIAESWAGVATETSTATGLVDGFIATSAPSLITTLGSIFKALIPLAIGFGLFNEQIRAVNESLTGFFSSIGLGSERYGTGTYRTTGDPAGGGAAYYNQDQMDGAWPVYDPIMDYATGSSKEGGGNTEVTVEINYGGVTVKNPQDAEILARETYALFQSRLRAEGVRA